MAYKDEHRKVTDEIIADLAKKLADSIDADIVEGILNGKSFARLELKDGVVHRESIPFPSVYITSENK